MTPQDPNALDRAIEHIHKEEIDPAVVAGAAERVWARLETAHAPLRTCADFQALLPDYRAGKLDEARTLLVRDHTHECVACRKALAARAGFSLQAGLQSRSAPRLPFFRWAMAATILLALGLSGWFAYNQFTSGAGRATIQAVNGSLYRAGDQGNIVLAAGSEFPDGAEIRTAKDSNAIVRLRDGSTIEVGERAAFAVNSSGRDLTIRLARGSLIVQAAKRRTGHLYVAMRDCRVAVTGTVFSVNSGVKGSRVTVIEGSVLVAQAGRERMLRPGDQLSTNPAMTPVPVRDEIAWSRHLDRHLAMLQLGKQLEQIRLPDLRYSSRILPLLPANTALYVALPNLGDALTQARQMIAAQAQTTPALREMVSGERNADQFLDKLRSASEYIGDEVVFAIPSVNGKWQQPVVLAQLKKPGFEDFVKSELHGDGQVSVRGDLAVISPANAPADLSGGLAATPFGQRIAEAYSKGAGILVAADLEQAKNKPPFAAVKYLVVEQKQTDTRAELSFPKGQGIFSWLADPGPNGALDFFSPEATMVSAFVIKDPGGLFDQLVQSRKGLEEANQLLGFDLRADLVGSLGGEFAFGIDGPVVPVPSWKAVVEVYNQSRLQYAIQKIVEAQQSHSPEHKAVLTTEVVSGRTWYRLTVSGGKPFTEADYTFVDGYLVAAPSRALVERAIQYRANGIGLARSAAFQKLLPRDGYTNFSGAVYYNVASTLGALAQGVAGVQPLTPEQKQRVESMAAQMQPTLITVYGGQDHLTLASSGSLLSLKNLMSMPLGFAGTMGPRHSYRRVE